MMGSIATSSLLLWCFMGCEEYSKNEGGAGLIGVVTSRSDWHCEGLFWIVRQAAHAVTTMDSLK